MTVDIPSEKERIEVEYEETMKRRGRKPKKVKLAVTKGAVGKGEAEDVAYKAIENVIKKYTAGTAYNLVIEYLAIGEEIRMKYEDIAYSLGFDNVKDFIEHAVDFYLHWSDKIKDILDELENLKAENVLLKTVASKDFKELVKAQFKRELMLYSIAFNVNPLLYIVLKEEIENLFNHDDNRNGREEISSNIETNEYSSGESQESGRSTSVSSQNVQEVSTKSGEPERASKPKSKHKKS